MVEQNREKQNVGEKKEEIGQKGGMEQKEGQQQQPKKPGMEEQNR